MLIKHITSAVSMKTACERWITVDMYYLANFKNRNVCVVSEAVLSFDHMLDMVLVSQAASFIPHVSLNFTDEKIQAKKIQVTLTTAIRLALKSTVLFLRHSQSKQARKMSEQ